MKWLSLLFVLATCGFGDNVRAHEHGGEVQDAAIAPVPDAPSSALPDAGLDAPPVTACTLVPQSGCSGATPACDLAPPLDGSGECRAVTHNGTSTSHCPLETDCKAGYTCLVSDTPSDNWCGRLCEHDQDCIGVGSRCTRTLYDAMDHPIPDILTCTEACDPVAQTGCASGLGCIVRPDPGGTFTRCYYLGTGHVGSACDSVADCSPGMECVTDHGVGTCQSYCRMTHTSDCPSGHTCNGFAQPNVLAAIEYGYCD